MADVRPRPTILQFAATLQSQKPEDKIREFVVAYYMEESAFEIFERHIPNSGFRGGKFMQKSVCKKLSGELYEPKDIYIGAILDLNNWKFVLQEASEDALKTMEAKSDIFVKSDLSELIRICRTKIGTKVPELLVAFQKKDAKKRGSIHMEETQGVLDQFGLAFGDQECLTLLRRYQVNGMEFDYQAFVEDLV